MYICLLPLEPPSHLPIHPTPLGCHRPRNCHLHSVPFDTCQGYWAVFSALPDTAPKSLRNGSPGHLQSCTLSPNVPTRPWFLSTRLCLLSSFFSQGPAPGHSRQAGLRFPSFLPNPSYLSVSSLVAWNSLLTSVNSALHAHSHPPQMVWNPVGYAWLSLVFGNTVVSVCWCGADILLFLFFSFFLFSPPFPPPLPPSLPSINSPSCKFFSHMSYDYVPYFVIKCGILHFNSSAGGGEHILSLCVICLGISTLLDVIKDTYKSI